MELRLLGPVELVGRSGPVGLGGPKERAVLAYLALHANQAVSEGLLIDAIWPDDPPRTAVRTLQAYVSRLRRVMTEAGDPADERLALESGPGGPRLRVASGCLDVERVESLLAQARTETADGDHVGAALTLAEALRAWRGTPLAEFSGAAWAIPATVRLGELRLHVIEERIDAELACGRHGALVGELDELCATHPLRERLWGQRMVALYRSGRQAEALRVFQELRRALGDELGIDPSPNLARLEQQILEQARDLDPGAAPMPAPPAPALRVSGVAQVDRPVPAAIYGLDGLRDQAFVGRGDELAELARAWARAREGNLEVVLLAGEPGIGKTALAARHAVEAGRSGATVLFGRCDEESLVPFQPFVEALGHYVDTTAPETLRAQLGARAEDLALVLPELGRVLPEVAGVAPTGAATERYRLFEAIPTLLRAMGTDAPVLLVLDDLHWADRPTLQLLQHVIRRGTATSLLVVGTYRDTDLVRTHPMAEALAEMRRANLITRVAVRGLGRDDVVEMVSGGSEPTDADRALGGALWDQTEGSPLFLREILRHLIETGAVTRDDDGRCRAERRLDQLGIPEGVREVIGRRLTRLSEPANSALLAGAVMGRELRLDVLELITDFTTDELVDALDEAAAAGVITEESGAVGRYSFTHALVRQALYGELSTTRRVRLHQRIGEALEKIHGDAEGAHLAELAHHFSQSAVAGTAEKAVLYALKAGEHARSIVAYEDAARHFANAIEVAEDAGFPPEERARIKVSIGDCLWFAGDHRVARATFEEALALAPDDPEVVGQAALGYAGARARIMWVDLVGAGAGARPVELLQRALALVPDDDSTLRARLLACLGQELYHESFGTDHFAVPEEAVAMARRLGDAETLVAVLCSANLALWRPGMVDQRLELVEEAAGVADAIGDDLGVGIAGFLRGHALCQLDRMREADDVWADAWGRLAALKVPERAVHQPANAGGVALMQGRLDEAEALFAEAFRAGQELRDPNVLAVYAGGMVTLRFAQGDTLGLIGLLHHGTALYEALEDLGKAFQAGALAENELLPQAQALLDPIDVADPERFPRNMFWLYCMHLVARTVRLLEDVETARATYDVIQPYADHNAGVGSIGFGSMRTALGWAAITLGLHDEAIAHLDAAIAASTRNGWVLPRLQAEIALADALRCRDGEGDRQRAVALLRAAEQACERLGVDGIGVDARRVRGRLAGSTATQPPGVTKAGRFARAKVKLAIFGAGVVARWTRGITDDELVRRFGRPVAQRALFAAMVRGFQPTMAFGFSGEITIELLPVFEDLDPRASDWWTIEVGPRKAKAREGRSDRPTTVIHITIADFLRLASGEGNIVELLRDGRFTIDGDVVLALRLQELFGAVELPDGF